MGLPQILVILSYSAQLAVIYRYHGKPIVQDIRVTAAHVALILGLMWWGGFFGGAQ